MPLLVHGEVTDPAIDIFDREAVFVDRVLDAAAARLSRAEDRARAHHHRRGRGASSPTVRRSLGGDDHAAAPASSTATRCSPAACARTPIACRSPSASGTGWRCARRRRRASPKFFLGTDSAPHVRRRQGIGVRLRGHLQRAVRAGELCAGVRRGGRARPVRGVRERAWRALLRAAAERGDGDAGARGVAVPARIGDVVPFRAGERSGGGWRRCTLVARQIRAVGRAARRPAGWRRRSARCRRRAAPRTAATSLCRVNFM